ncbi:hypothetical protein [Pantoea sp. CCBC3-3-1]|uniref:hypothetical protein n=1 Tax=Pantoea sp. CCBC3-3-1 TaxID=2490851 RepID=UPI0011BF0F30|nr:hypothetical protein [Pantoea sp. CCBC3-3-1]
MAKHDITTFYFDNLDLMIILEPHTFYVAEARRRLLSQFNDISREADKKEQQVYEALGRSFNPDYDDEFDSAERAYQEGISHYLNLHEMQNIVTLALTAGMYHQFDKALRDKLSREVSHWQDRDIWEPMIWNLDLPQVIELMDWIGLGVTGKPFYPKINACRLVVNVYKHGYGQSHKTLIETFPEYYPQTFAHSMPRYSDPRPEQLKVSEAQFVEFSDAIEAFWRSFPMYTYASQMGAQPKWLAGKVAKTEKWVKKP